MMQIKVRHENQDEQQAAYFGQITPTSDIERFIDHLRSQGGIRFEGRQYMQLKHQIVMRNRLCYLELILSDGEFADESQPSKRSKRKKTAK